MAKQTLPKPETVPFENIYLKCVMVASKKTIVICPDQGLESSFLEYTDIDSVPVDKWLQADIFQNADGKGYFIKNSIKTCATPNKKEIGDVEKRVQKTFETIKEMQLEIEKIKASFFKVDNEIPPIPKDLFISDKVWDLAAASIKLDKYTILLGPKGCGKTETAKQLAIACDFNFVPFNMGAAFKPKQMFAGMLQAENGNTVFIESEFLKAFQATEPTLIFLDEITRLPQVASNYLMTILDRNQSYIYIEELGKRIFRGAGVRFISAGNVGSQYTDTRTLDGAFWDRFIKLPIDYLPKAEEEKLVCSRALKANKAHVRSLIERANKCREAEKSGSITSGISTRQLIDMSHYLEIGFSVDDVFENIFLNNFINGNTNEIAEVRAITQSC